MTIIRTESAMDRRDFLHRAATTGTALFLPSFAGARAKGVEWPIGCFNRP